VAPLTLKLVNLIFDIPARFEIFCFLRRGSSINQLTHCTHAEYRLGVIDSIFMEQLFAPRCSGK
jgi:hypothetical protein